MPGRPRRCFKNGLAFSDLRFCIGFYRVCERCGVHKEKIPIFEKHALPYCKQWAADSIAPRVPPARFCEESGRWVAESRARGGEEQSAARKNRTATSTKTTIAVTTGTTEKKAQKKNNNDNASSSNTQRTQGAPRG